jgi:hypothetical protein
MVAWPGDSTVSTSPWWRPRNSTRSAAAVPRPP